MTALRSALLFALLALPSCHDRRAADQRTFTEGMKEYLARRGDLCVGKSSWPIDVTPAEFNGNGRNAVQMPVLERLGLVHGEDTLAETQTEDGRVNHEVRRYELTPEGQRYYLARERGRGQTANAPPQKDLCVAKLSLDKVLSWAAPTTGATPRTIVKYTYRIEAAPWTNDPDVQRTFPMVARVIHGAGHNHLEEPFTLTNEGWVADDLLTESTPPPEVARAEHE